MPLPNHQDLGAVERCVADAARLCCSVTRTTFGDPATMYLSVSLEDVQSLLGSSELKDVEDQVVRRLGSKVVANAFATPLQKQLSYAGVSVSSIYALLRRERGLLIRFALLCQGASPGSDGSDGEFPPGDEPDPADKSQLVEVLGHEHGFVVSHAIDLILARRGKEELLRYVKWRRIPSHARHCTAVLRNLKASS